MLQDGDSGATGLPSVVFVCDGNTCRSPIAEVLARSMFGEKISRFASVGLAACDGAPAHGNAVAAAAALGLDLTSHRARSVGGLDTGAPVAWFIAMNRSQAARLRVAGVARGGAAIGILGAPGLDVSRAGQGPACPEVADPWGGDAEAYRTTAGRIARLLEAWRPYLADDGIRAGG
jgi:protein-tyrosine-phosphatase